MRRTSFCKKLTAFFGLTILLGLAAFGMARAGVSLRTESDLVLVPVTVTDRNGATVADLAPSNFQILDNGEPRSIFSFERDDAPMSVVLVVDTSASMRSKIVRTRIALRNLAAAADPDDEAALLTFASQPHLRSGFTQDIDKLASSLDFEEPAGATALIDGIWQALEAVQQGHNSRKVVIVISDGGDNNSRRTASELLNAATETRAQIYCISIQGRHFNAAERSGSDLLHRLSETTGGLDFAILSSQQLPETAAKISDAIHNLYVLGFKPPSAGPSPQWHRIRVRMEHASRHNLRISAKSAYFRDSE